MSLELKNEFLDAYKALDQLCKDTYQTEKGITTYIERMKKHKSEGKQKIEYFEYDYKILKRERHIYHQIMKEQKVSSLSKKDILYLKEIYELISNQEDPLYMLGKLHRIESKRLILWDENDDDFDLMMIPVILPMKL